MSPIMGIGFIYIICFLLAGVIAFRYLLSE